jgi:uncharacterized protein with PQ loop repeat
MLDTPTLLFSVLIILVSLWILFSVSLVILQISSDGKPEWVRDVSNQVIPIPVHHKDTDKRLQALGLEKLGVMEVKMRYLNVGYAWAYRSLHGEFCVWVVYETIAPVVIRAMSCYADNAVLITGFPVGEQITTKNFISGFVKTDIATAIDYHQYQIEQWEATQGRPLLTYTLEDANRYDEVFRIHHRRTDYQRTLRLSLLQIGAAFSTIAAQGILIAVSLTNNAALYIPTAFVTSIITVAAFIIYFYVSRQLTNPPNDLERKATEAA